MTIIGLVAAISTAAGPNMPPPDTCNEHDGQVCTTGWCSPSNPGIYVCAEYLYCWDCKCTTSCGTTGFVWNSRCIPPTETCNGRDDDCDGETDEGNVCTPPSYPCGTHACARGEFPPATWRPYATTSPFNSPVPANPALIPSTYCNSVPAGSTCSNVMVTRLLELAINTHPANWLIAFNGSTGWPTYYGTATDPQYSFECTMYPCADMGRGRAPAGAQTQGVGDPANTDHHLTFIDQSTTDLREFDLWRVEWSTLPAAAGTIRASGGGFTSALADGRSQSSGEGNAGRFGNLAGRIRLEEMQDALACANGSAGCIGGRNYINHALTIAIRCTSGLSIWPAGTNHGLQCSNPANAPPMGAHLYLNMTIAVIDALPPTVPQWKKVLLRTLSVYGAYVNDTGSNFYFDWQLESGAQYTSMGVPDLWLSWAASMKTMQPTQDWADWSDEFGTGYKGLWDAPDGIDWDSQVWSNLQILAQ